jgi:hypothetical protein
LDSDKVDDKQLDILDCNCVKTVKRLRASCWKNSVLRTENSAVNTRTICLPSIYIYIYIYIMLKFSMPEKLLRTQWRSGRLSGLWFVIWRLKVHVQIFFRNIAGNSGGAKNSAEFLVLKWHNFLPYIRIYCTTSGLVTGN